MIHSKALRCFLILCLLGRFLVSCTTNSTNDESNTPGNSSGVTSPSATDDINSNQSELLNTIVGTSDQGIIRGINFGDPVSQVRASESFEMFEDSLSHIGYTFETDQLETIDVLYYITPTGQAVNKIMVDIYLNSDSATQQLLASARKRFTAKYGNPQETKEKQIVWKKDPVRVTIMDVSEGKDYGLKFVFEPTNKTILASN